MPEQPQEQHFARAAYRHYRDAVYLYDDDRFPNADHHFGFAVECALKSLMLRFLDATMIKKTGKPSKLPVSINASGEEKEYRHLPDLWFDVALLLHGRSGSRLAGLLKTSVPFEGWDVSHRYHGDPKLDQVVVEDRKSAAHRILELHEQALVDGGIR